MLFFFVETNILVNSQIKISNSQSEHLKISFSTMRTHIYRIILDSIRENRNLFHSSNVFLLFRLRLTNNNLYI